uniref:BUB1 N-terminal domain-containing protein n=1 Tax=Cyprinodon variegatus TaxID=28743 RepID=A0A3Q2FLB7_CYPVA
MCNHVFSKGVGSRTAELYVAWAQQLEKKGMNQEAGGVYQKALENQAQPADLLLNEYSMNPLTLPWFPAGTYCLSITTSCTQNHRHVSLMGLGEVSPAHLL